MTRPPSRPAFGAHLDDPIGLSQDVDVMIDEKDRVAVRHQVVHHGLEPLDVGGMEPIEGSSST